MTKELQSIIKSKTTTELHEFLGIPEATFISNLKVTLVYTGGIEGNPEYHFTWIQIPDIDNGREIINENPK